MTLEFAPAVPTSDLAKTKADFLAAGHKEEEIDAAIEELKKDKIYQSLCGTYQVNVREVKEHGFGTKVIWLSIKRIDRETIHDWRDLQEIKNALVGPECEGFEIYPAESRLVDSANQYHLWVFADPTIRLPIGFQERFVTDTPVANTKQRRFGT